MVEVAKLSVVVDADTSAAERELDTFGNKVGGVGSSIATAFGGAAIAGIAGVAAGLSASVVAASGFETTMSAVKAVSGATATEMESLSGLALQLGKDTSFSASEAGKGIEELVKGGLTIPDIMNGAAKATLDLAAAGGVSLPEAATIAANALAQFNLKGEDMGHVADLIAGAANASALDVGDFSYSLKAAGAVASTVGFNFDDLAQAIAIMGKAGITGSDAGTSLKTMMLNLQPSTNKQKDLFRELGLETNNLQAGLDGMRKRGIEPLTNDWPGLNRAMIESLGFSQDVSKWTNKQHDEFDNLSRSLGATGSAFFDANGKVKSMAEVAQVLQTALEGQTEAQKLANLETIFGSDAIRAAAVLAKEGAAGFNDMAAAMGKVSAEAVGAEKLNNLAGSWEQLKGSLETAAITIGLSLLPVLTDLVRWATDGVNDMIPILDSLGKGFADVVTLMTGDGDRLNAAFDRLSEGLADALGPELATEIINTLLDIRTTFADFMSTMRALMDADGSAMALSWKTMWASMATETLLRTQDMMSGLRVVMALMRGDWDVFWGELELLQTNSQKRQQVETERNASIARGFLDTWTGGYASKWEDWLNNLDELVVDGWRSISEATSTALTAVGRVISDAWGAMVTTVTTGMDRIFTPIRDTWNAAQDVSDTVNRAIKNTLTAIWDEIYQSVIKPKLDLISTFISTTWETIRSAVETKVNLARDVIGAAWDVVSTKTTEVLNAVLTFVRDTIFEPIRAAVETKINAARDLFGQAIDAVKTKAEGVLGPLLAWWRDTIWEPMRAATETATTGGQGILAKFTAAVDGVKTVVDTTLDSIKNVWTTTWTAIQKAAESPKAAMDVLIDLVGKLKQIMPEWLIPHSPTPFQVGLEGIMKAAKGMDGAFGGMGGGLEMIQQIGAMASQIGGLDFGRAAAAIAASETGGGTHLIQQGGGGGVGPFQFDPGGELQNFARDLHVSMAEAARIAVADPAKAAAWALHGYLGTALRAGIENGLSGAALADFGSRYGQRPYGDNWKMAGEWFRRLFPGLAEGGIVTRPTLAMIGERGAEAVIPLTGSGLGGSTTYVIDARGAQVYDGSKFVDMLVSTLEKAERGGRIVKVTR